MTQAEFDELLVWVAEDWAERRLEGSGRVIWWDELSMDLHRAISGVVRWGQAHGMMTVTPAASAGVKAALRRVRAEDLSLYKRVGLDG